MIISTHRCKKCKGSKINAVYDMDDDRNKFNCLDCGKAWTAPTLEKTISDIRGELGKRGA